MITVRFGNASEFVSIELPKTFSQEGWAKARVEVAAHCFRGDISPFIEAKDLQPFLSQLKALYQSLEGAAEFSPLEQQFTLKIVGNGRGQMHVSGVAWSMAMHENRLSFQIELDQTYLADPIANLEAALER
jgi:hypothetical protein